MGDHESREQGIEFGPLAEALENESYPMKMAAVLETYGEHELELEDGSTTVGKVLSEEREREFEDAEEVRQAIFNMVGAAAVGRRGYSDRGGETPEKDADDESM